jgi:hypothetical protein
MHDVSSEGPCTHNKRMVRQMELSKGNDQYLTKTGIDRVHPKFDLTGLPKSFVTKWDLLSAEERDSLENTSCGLNCAGCGMTLATEADFARHFILTRGLQYRNLGDCPLTVLRNF